MKIIKYSSLSLVLFASIHMAAMADQKIKPESITIEGKLGTIKEERVKSIQSEVTYTPSGSGIGYSIIKPVQEGGSMLDEHSSSGELSIPSWTLFNW